jgi:hypothetical protein
MNSLFVVFEGVWGAIILAIIYKSSREIFIIIFEI